MGDDKKDQGGDDKGFKLKNETRARDADIERALDERVRAERLNRRSDPEE